MPVTRTAAAGTDAGTGPRHSSNRLDMNRNTDLASRVARGEYEIDEHRVAEAMLRRRGNGLLMLVPARVESPSGGGPQDDPGPGLSAA
jgi:hypothetical protein